VTITEDDHAQFETTVGDFHTQPEPDSCLPTAVKNVLQELAARQERSGLEHSVSDVADALDYEQGRAAVSDRIATRLDPLVEADGYEVKVKVGVEFDELREIIERDDRSLPICELHASYFEELRSQDIGYVPEPGRDDYGRWPHVVIPMAINHDTVLYFDPFVHFFHDLADLEESGALVQPIATFSEWWTRPEKRWTLWFEQTGQQTLSAVGDEH